MPDKTFHITTFGCKANQYDSQLWRTSLENAGLQYDAASPDILLVNTCSVTTAAEQQARQTIRKIIRNGPAARVVITGCYGQLSASELKKINGVDLVLGRYGKETAAGLLSWLNLGSNEIPSGIRSFRGHTRAFIKVQDGCNHCCSYCIVPLARGPSRSRPLDEILSEARALTVSGHRELVITGIRLGDFKPSLGLLLRSLKDVPGLERIRLSSLEPDDLNEDLIEAMQDTPALARHLHLPLQSGCDSILRVMNRPYTVAYCRELLAKLRRAMPGITIGSDVIVGFPGETEEHFGQSVRNIRELGFIHLHIFGYSKRPGTRAAGMPNQIPDSIKRERLQRLRDVYEKMQNEYFASRRGQAELVLAETCDNGMWSGFGEHYHKVYFRSEGDARNKLVRVRLSGPFQQGMSAEIMTAEF
jgi:threonylcarbamoyladenosine tRNA methylthiotransferase MtaB